MLAKSCLLWSKLQRPVSLRSTLTALVLVTMIPLLVFAVAMIVRTARDERATFQRGATERTLALVTAVDAELKTSITTLEALATSRHLETDDLRAFHDEAARVLKSQPNWLTINLAQPSVQQVVNILRPFGTELGLIAELPSFERVLRTGKPAVGSLVYGRLTQQHDFGVRVPVIREGVTKYVLSAVVKPQTISDLLTAQRLPPDWVGVVVDGNGRIVARTVDPERSVGQAASDSLRLALARSSEGWFQGSTIEGWEVYTPFNRSQFSGWTVAMGIPAASVEASLRRSLSLVALFGTLLLALAIALAWLLSNRTIKSIQSLTDIAENLGLGKAPPTGVAGVNNAPSRIAEVEEVRESLFTASRLIQERSDERDRVEAVLRQVSERLELAQDAGSIGSFERNLVTNEVKWSASQEKLYGLAPGSFGGKHEDWAKQVHPDDLARIEGAVRNAAETQIPIGHEFRIIRPDGATRWVLSQARVIADEAGVRSMLGVNIDITARKEAEEALREADRRKNEFLAILGHELRNPLGVISNAVQMLREIGSAELNLQELQEMMERQVIHTSRMLDDLLDISRISNGKIQLTRKPCDFRDIVRETAEDFRSTSADNGLRLEMNLADQPFPVLGDRIRLAQALSNLLQNACKFTESGGTVRLNLEAEEKTSATLRVKDTGIGIEPKALAWIFEPFSQAERSLDRSRGGLGLGLALVKGIVELHGGMVQASSEGPGRGSEFTVRLPLDHAQALAAPPAVGENRSNRSCRILIIEDNPLGARSLRILLEHMGHAVAVAHNGLVALETARKFQPEVVLCDIGLPGLDGYGVAQALRQQAGSEGAYVICVSGYAEDEQRARDAGFNAHLNKPVNIAELEPTVDGTLEQTTAMTQKPTTTTRSTVQSQRRTVEYLKAVELWNSAAL